MGSIDHIKSSFVVVISYVLNFPFLLAVSSIEEKGEPEERNVKCIQYYDGMIESQTPINALSHIILSNRANIEIL